MGCMHEVCFHLCSETITNMKVYVMKTARCETAPLWVFFLKQDATCRAESRVKPFVTQTHHHFSNQIEITVYLISTCCKSHLFGFFWWLSEIHTCSIRHSMPDCRIPANLQTWMGPSAVYWFSSCKNATCKDYIIRIYIYIDVYVNIWAKYITSHTMF